MWKRGLELSRRSLRLQDSQALLNSKRPCFVLQVNLAIRNPNIRKILLYESSATDCFCTQLFRPHYSEKRAIVKVKCLVRLINLATGKKYLI